MALKVCQFAQRAKKKSSAVSKLLSYSKRAFSYYHLFSSARLSNDQIISLSFLCHARKHSEFFFLFPQLIALNEKKKKNLSWLLFGVGRRRTDKIP